MGEIIRIDDIEASDAEKRLILRAVTDTKFRESLERQASGGELTDADLEGVAGGFAGFDAANLRSVLTIVKNIGLRIQMGAQMLCMGGG